jgi:hypothetical protein
MPSLDSKRATERMLSLLATAVCRSPVTVVTSSRIVAPGCASMKRRTIWVDPARVGPYDVVLLAGLLRERRGGRAFASGEGPSLRARRRRVERARRVLESEYPALRGLDGIWRARRNDELGEHEAPSGARGPLVPAPEIVWDAPTMRGLDAAGGDLAAKLVPGESLHGIEGDLARVAEGIASGRIPTKTHPALPEMPYVVVPLSLRMHDVARETTDEERQIRRDVDRMAQGIVTCYENKTKGTHLARVRPPRSSGSRLDSRRLHEVAVAMRTGRPARPFSRPPREVQTMFRPEQHYGLLGFDALSLHAAVSRHGRLSVNLLRVFTRCFEMMEIDCVVVAFRDRVLDLPDGRRCYLHVPCVAKAIDEPFSDAVWQRLQALWAPPAGAGTPACFVPLHIETMAEHAREATASSERRFLALQYMSVSGMPTAIETYAHRSGAAASIDRALTALRADVEAEWDFSLFIPHALIAAAPPGGTVASACDLGI